MARSGRQQRMGTADQEKKNTVAGKICFLCFYAPDVVGGRVPKHDIGSKPNALLTNEHGNQPFRGFSLRTTSCRCTVAWRRQHLLPPHHQSPSKTTRDCRPTPHDPSAQPAAQKWLYSNSRACCSSITEMPTREDALWSLAHRVICRALPPTRAHNGNHHHHHQQHERQGGREKEREGADGASFRRRSTPTHPAPPS